MKTAAQATNQDSNRTAFVTLVRFKREVLSRGSSIAFHRGERVARVASGGCAQQILDHWTVWLEGAFRSSRGTLEMSTASRGLTLLVLPIDRAKRSVVLGRSFVSEPVGVRHTHAPTPLMFEVEGGRCRRAARRTASDVARVRVGADETARCPRDSVAAIEDAVIDVFSLARCQRILGSE
jgi:hypothetical protein